MNGPSKNSSIAGVKVDNSDFAVLPCVPCHNPAEEPLFRRKIVCGDDDESPLLMFVFCCCHLVRS